MYIFIEKKIYNMKKETSILIRLETDSQTEYKSLCKKHGNNMSQRIRNFIEKEVKELKEKKSGV